MKKSSFVPSLVAALVCSFALPAALNAQNNFVVNPQSLTFTRVGTSDPNPQTLTVSTTLTSVQITVTEQFSPSVSKWLFAIPNSQVTPAQVQVFVTGGVLPAGTHTGSVQISAAGVANSPITVPVTFVVGAASQLTASPAQLAFNSIIGGSAPAAQTVTVNTSGGIQIPFSASVSTLIGGNWLQVTPLTATAPNAVLSVSVNPAGLAVGTYTGTLTLTPTSGGSGPLAIPVTLTVAATPPLTATPTALNFFYQIGGAAPAQQLLSLATPGTNLGFGITATSSNNWLVVGLVNGVTPADVPVGVSAAVLGSLPQGTYTGQIRVTAPGANNSPLDVPVTLTVSNNPLIVSTPAALTFDIQPGGAAPATQALTISSSGTPLSFTASTATSTTGINWLTTTPASGTTPTTVNVGIGPGGLLLAPGTYTGIVIISSGGAGNTLNVPVTLNVSNTPVLAIYPSTLSFVFQIGHTVPPAQTVSLSSTAAPISFTATASASWITVSQSVGVTPATLAITVNPSGLSGGNNTGTVTITPQVTGATAQTLNLSLGISASPLVSASPNALTFNFAPGGNMFQFQNLAVTSTSDPLNITATAATTTGPSGWLGVSPLTAATPSNLNVFVNATGLAPGSYSGSVTVTATNGALNGQTIPVSVTVSTGNNLTVGPATLAFEQALGGAAPAAKTITVGSSGASLPFAVSVTPAGSWLAATPATGSTPVTISVTVNGAGLAQGVYDGAVTISSTGAGNSPQTVPVRLTIGAAQTIAVSPATLTFNFQQGGTTPAVQKISVTATGGAINFTAAAASQSPFSNWLSISPTNGATPNEITVSVNPAGLTPSDSPYNGTVTITAPGASNSPQTVTVRLNVTGRPKPEVRTVVNAATFVPGPISRGAIMSIGGAELGPATGVLLRLTAAGTVDTTLSDVRVLFDGIAAPLLFVRRDQINTIVPYAVAARAATQLVVEYQGARSDAVPLRVVDTAPGIFTVTQTGSGQGAILNQNFSVNGSNNPAERRSTVMIFGTGEGQTTPPGLDAIVTGSLLRRPIANVRVLIGNRLAQVDYAGSAPGLVAGVVQINAVVPDDIGAGTVPVIVEIGGVASPPATMAVR